MRPAIIRWRPFRAGVSARLQTHRGKVPDLHASNHTGAMAAACSGTPPNLGSRVSPLAPHRAPGHQALQHPLLRPQHRLRPQDHRLRAGQGPRRPGKHTCGQTSGQTVRQMTW